MIARCSNNYGPRQHREKLIPTLVHHALQNDPLPTYDSGKQIRDWIHVNDTARGLINIFKSGGNCERTNIEIANTVLKHHNKPESLIDHVSDRPGHDARYAIDATRATTDLNWQPQIPFEKGFEQVVRELSIALIPN